MGVNDIVLLSEVLSDMKTGYAFYEDRREGLGEYFKQNLLADIESLKISAGFHAKKSGLHRMSSKRFPYFVYYQVLENTAYVVAVLPVRRNPSVILKTLQKRQ